MKSNLEIRISSFFRHFASHIPHTLPPANVIRPSAIGGQLSSNTRFQKVKNMKNGPQKMIPVLSHSRAPSGDEKKQGASGRRDSLGSEKVKKMKNGPQKIEASFARIEAQLLARQELLASSGRVEENWRTYRQRRLGPYYRLVFRENKQKRSIYLGRCPILAERVRRFLADLQRPARERRYLRRLRRKTRAALRLETKTLAAYLAPLGFHVKGGFIRRRRVQKVGGTSKAQSHQMLSLTKKRNSLPPSIPLPIPSPR